MKEKYIPGMFTSDEIIQQYLMSFDLTQEVVPSDAAEEITTFYDAGWKKIDEERETYNRTQKPIHPQSGEEATFIGYTYIYPIYKTTSGLYLMRMKNKYYSVTPLSPDAERELRPSL